MLLKTAYFYLCFSSSVLMALTAYSSSNHPYLCSWLRPLASWRQEQGFNHNNWCRGRLRGMSWTGTTGEKSNEMQEEVTILRRKAMRRRRRGEYQPVGIDEGGSRCKAVRWCRHGDIGWKSRCAILSPPHDGVMWGVKRWGGGWKQTKEWGKTDFIWPCHVSLFFTVSILFFSFTQVNAIASYWM